MSNNAHELSNRLLNALDNNYNVVDMHAVNEIISILERINITKELLETTRLGKHVNELRRKTSDPSLARRAKVLVKRWRDLVIPTVASPGHTGSNRSSAERQVRRLGTTPLTSPALTRHVVSPAVPSPRPPSRPTWGGYESDSQDVILVDDDPPAAPPPPPPSLPAHKPLTPPVKRPLSTEPLYDEKKAKRDKKPKKRRGPSRAGSGAEGVTVGADPAPPSVPPPPPPAAPHGTPGSEQWASRNGGAHSDRRRNGYRTHHPLDPYAALAQRMPPTTGKKVKTTKELLEQIQSRGTKPTTSPPSPASPHSPHSPDVMLIEPESCPLKVESPLRNGGVSPVSVPPVRSLPPLEDEREYWECTCEGDADEECPAARRTAVRPLHVRALHHVYLPGVNGTRAPLHPHRFAVRPPDDPDRPGLFASVVPLYKYSDYADDRCAKNMDRVPLCPTLPWTEFAPAPPDLPPPPSPPPLRPYPLPPPEDDSADLPDIKQEKEDDTSEPEPMETECPPESDSNDRLKAPLPSTEDESRSVKSEPEVKMEVTEEHATEQLDHRTVERTKGELDGRALYETCQRTIDRIVYDYGQLAAAPVVTLSGEAGECEGEVRARLEGALAAAEAEREPDALGRPPAPPNFAEWHECAQLGELIALPYVVID